MSFHELNLDQQIVASLEAIGCRSPRPIQAQAAEPVLAGRDVIGLAQTGTGKTIAFAAPMCQRLLRDRPQIAQGASKGRRRSPARIAPRHRSVRALVLCPTRELAQQVEGVIASLIRGTVLRSLCVFGKVGITPQANAIAAGIDILVATPGRVRELLEASALALDEIRCIAIDEADRMLDIGFLPQVANILDMVPENAQRLLFTATMPGEVEQLARRFLTNPVRIEVGRHTTTVDHVGQRLIETLDRHKVPLLLELIEKQNRRGVLIFCRTRRRVGWVGAALRRHGMRVGMIHGDRTQAQRQRALEKFSSGEFDVMVATDVASRGLHIPQVRTVLNYDVPGNAEDYVHRIGRAGHGQIGDGRSRRSSAHAESVTLLTPRDQDQWNAIARVVEIDLDVERIDGFAPALRHGGGSAGLQSKPGAIRTGKRGPRRDDEAGDDRRAPSMRKGRIKRRGNRRRPITKDQKPGTGVRRTDQGG